jgi:hypothetical protein
MLHRVLRMRLKASGREEWPQVLLRELRCIEHQSAKTADGQVVRGITELGAQQRELFAAIDTKPPTPATVTLSQVQLAQQVDL